LLQARRFIVSGRVQGVWFRDSTRRMALDLGITGHALNLDNGNVEVLACGSGEKLQQLRNWLHEGPPLAAVAQVDEAEVPHQELADFRVG
jgi:acylphosphatase